MLRTNPARRRSALASTVLIAALVLSACGGGSDSASDEETTTTTAAKSTTTAAPASDDRPQAIQDFATALEGSGFDEEQITCILEVAQEGLVNASDVEALDAAYQEQCDLTSSEVTAGAYYAAMVELGIPEKDADCVRDLYATLTPEQAAVFGEDLEARDSLLKGCNIDPADLPTS